MAGTSFGARFADMMRPDRLGLVDLHSEHVARQRVMRAAAAGTSLAGPPVSSTQSGHVPGPVREVRVERLADNFRPAQEGVARRARSSSGRGGGGAGVVGHYSVTDRAGWGARAGTRYRATRGAHFQVPETASYPVRCLRCDLTRATKVVA